MQGVARAITWSDDFEDYLCIMRTPYLLLSFLSLICADIIPYLLVSWKPVERNKVLLKINRKIPTHK